ncbi:MAG: hypothetical protein HOW71_45355 [Nonomuraea sp.]|nr:hypothetical protein [Nonomuraea sp.]
MRREWEPEELIAAWTLLDGDWDLVGNKTGATPYEQALERFDPRWVRSSGGRIRASWGSGVCTGELARFHEAVEAAARSGALPESARAVVELARLESDAERAAELRAGAAVLSGRVPGSLADALRLAGV